MGWVYLTSLLVVLACLVLIDRRLRLAFFIAPVRSAVVVGVTTVFLIAWDASGISLGIFRHVNGALQSGLLLAPAFPIEELVFLVFLVYLTLVLVRGVCLALDRVAHRALHR